MTPSALASRPCGEQALAKSRRSAGVTSSLSQDLSATTTSKARAIVYGAAVKVGRAVLPALVELIAFAAVMSFMVGTAMLALGAGDTITLWRAP